MSDLSRILPESESVSPDTDIFGPEPAHTWCYFFQKADLARQMRDWNAALDLYKQAQRLGLNPEYGAEYLPFIEAFAQTGDWQKAHNLTMAADELTPRPNHKLMLCTNWARLAAIPSADMTMVEQVAQDLSC